METLGRLEAARYMGGHRFIAASELESRSLFEIGRATPLRLVDISSGEGQSRIGADDRLNSEGAREISQLWSRAIWTHRVRADGIAYQPRNASGHQALAVFDRAAAGLSERSRGRLGSKELAIELGGVLEEFHIGLD